MSPITPPEEIKIKKAHCSKCGGERNCDIRGQHDERFSDENFDCCTSWYLLQCCGCEHVFIQTVYVDSESIDWGYDSIGGEMGKTVETIRYWPALAKRKRPDWITSHGIDCEQNVDALDASLFELYGALDNDLTILAAIGIRTSFDIASELLGIKSELTFRNKLDELVKRGHIGAVDKEHLDALIDAGSASAHRGWHPTPEDLNTMMEVLENFLHASFAAPKKQKRLQDKVSKMRKTVPPRPKKARKVKIP
jgi:hypothetical protein